MRRHARHPLAAPLVAALLLALSTHCVDAADGGGLPAPAPSARARPPAPMKPPLAAAAARPPSAAHSLGWTNMGVLLNASQPELVVQALAVVGGRPVVGLAGFAGRPEVHARLANGSWTRAGADAVLDETAPTLRLAAGGNGSSLYASLTNTGADVTYPSAQGDSPHGWVRALLGGVGTNWTYLGRGDASGRGASIARPRRPGEPLALAVDGDRAAVAYNDRVDTYVLRFDPASGWSKPCVIDWTAGGGTRDTARVAALAQDGAVTYALVATDELDGGVAAYVLKLDAGGAWSRVGPGPAARAGAWRWAGLALDAARAPVVALGGPPRAPSPTPASRKEDVVSPSVKAAAAPPPGAPPSVAAAVVRFDPTTRAWAHLPPLAGPTSSGGAIAAQGDELVVATVVPGGKPAVARSIARGPWASIRRADPLPPVADVASLQLAILPGGGPVLAYQAARKRGTGPLVAACARCVVPKAPAPAPAPPAVPAAVKAAPAPAVATASAAVASGGRRMK